MLVREADDGVTVIGQASHAWLSGQLARAWGNREFDRPEPFEEVCLAAEQHDVGMAEWDLAPALQPGRGRPQSFMEMSLSDHLALWSAAPSKLLTQSRYAALLVSMHGTALYERRDLSRLSEADAAAVRDHLAGETRWQGSVRDLLGADVRRLRRNQRLLWAWDGLSLALCLGWRPYVAEEVPAAGDTVRAVRLEPLEGPHGGRYTLDPWPFGLGEVEVACEARRLQGRHEEPAALHAELERASSIRLTYTLLPRTG